jgi:hypothetical protein
MAVILRSSELLGIREVWDERISHILVIGRVAIAIEGF